MRIENEDFIRRSYNMETVQGYYDYLDYVHQTPGTPIKTINKGWSSTDTLGRAFEPNKYSELNFKTVNSSNQSEANKH